MKNKKIISFFFILFCLVSLSNALGEEIIFETPEIEVLENGNLLKAHKGGKAVIDSNTEIIADKFEYNKLTKVLTARGNAQGIDSLNKVTIDADELEYNKATSVYKGKGNARAVDNLSKVTIDADELEYDKTILKYTAYKNVKVIDSLNNVVTEANKIIYLRNQEKIFSEGKTKITIENKYKINSKNVVWLRNEEQISSNEYTILLDDENNIYEAKKFRYLTGTKLFRGIKATLTYSNKDLYQFEDVFINLETNELHGKDIEVNFHNEMFDNKENEPRLKGNKSYSNKNITTVSKGVFTTCKRRPGKKCPPWKVEAKEVKHDKKKKTVYYKNAWLKIYNVPVLYYPFFFHPDPTVKRQSGFLSPQTGDHEILGSSLYIPYFYAISDTQDLTLKPRVFFNDKFSLQTEYRKASKKAQHIFDFSITEGHQSLKSDNEDSRSHFFSNSIIDLDMSYFDVSNLEVQLQKTSNNTYLKLFGLESPLFGDAGSSEISSLTSFINLTANSEDLDLNVATRLYENLDAANNDRYQFVFPSYSLNKNIENNALKGSLLFKSSGSQHFYNTNIVETRIINDLLYNSEDNFLDNGLKNNYTVLFKNVNSEGKNSSSYKENLQSEFLSSFVFQSSYPLLREGINFNNYLTPKISLRYSPNNMKNKSGEDRRININNIFSFNRLGFSDEVESGQSLTIGADHLINKIVYDEENLPYSKHFIDLSLATVFRDEINEDIPASSSLGNKSSDVVGKIGFSPNSFFNTTYNFSVDNNIEQFKYHDIAAKFTVNNFVTSFKYIEEKDVIGDAHYYTNITEYKFNENNSFYFETRRNKKIDMTEFYDLIYQYKNDCLIASLKYNKKFYNDSDILPSEQLFFTITVVPLGAYDSNDLIRNK